MSSANKHYTNAKFLQYIRAFNAQDYNTQHAFYHPEIQLLLPQPENLPPLIGSEGIKGHYLPLFERFVEVITPIELIINDDAIFFIMETCFQAKDDLPAGVLSPGGFPNVKKDGIVRVTIWAYYNLENGLMKKIQCVQVQGENLGTKKTLDERLAESRSRAKKELLAF